MTCTQQGEGATPGLGQNWLTLCIGFRFGQALTRARYGAWSYFIGTIERYFDQRAGLDGDTTGGHLIKEKILSCEGISPQEYLGG